MRAGPWARGVACPPLCALKAGTGYVAALYDACQCRLPAGCRCSADGAAGFDMIADDQVRLDGLWASAPAALAGLLEVRGLGVLRLPYVAAALVLVVQLGRGERLPEAESFPDLDLPLIHVDAGASSAHLRVALALDCLLGMVPMVAGAFA